MNRDKTLGDFPDKFGEINEKKKNFQNEFDGNILANEIEMQLSEELLVSDRLSGITFILYYKKGGER